MESILSNGELTVRILRKGAEVASVKNAAGTEFMWQADPGVWPRHAPVLFPIVGKLRNDRYSFQGKEFTMSQHGFARDKVFECTESKSDRCVYLLKQDEAGRAQYPFDFTLSIIYSIEGNVLSTAYEVHNPGRAELLFSIGAHPGFRCPLEKGETYEDYYLEFESDASLQCVLNGGLRTSHYKLVPVQERRLQLTATLFDEDALVFEKGQVSRISLCSSKSARRVEIGCKDWPYFGIWAKRGCRRFVCLEPWFGIADREEAGGQLEDKEGIIRLAAGDTFRCRYNTRFV